VPRRFTIPKVEGQRNEDSYRTSSRGVYALSDGASISFDSASWARILVRRFARDPTFTSTWVMAAIAQFSRLHDRDNLPWMKQASFDRGTFASLLGVQVFDQGKSVQVLAIGDSLAVLGDGDRIIETFPYSKPSEFEQSPRLLCTNPAENSFLCEKNYTKSWTFDGLGQPTLLCMTDALGHWLLSRRDEGQSPIAMLRSITSSKSFKQFVHTERASSRMKRDDTTLIVFP
jgi:hypothetical protein